MMEVKQKSNEEIAVQTASLGSLRESVRNDLARIDMLEQYSKLPGAYEGPPRSYAILNTYLKSAPDLDFMFLAANDHDNRKSNLHLLSGASVLRHGESALEIKEFFGEAPEQLMREILKRAQEKGLEYLIVDRSCQGINWLINELGVDTKPGTSETHVILKIDGPSPQLVSRGDIGGKPGINDEYMNNSIYQLTKRQVYSKNGAAQEILDAINRGSDYDAVRTIMRSLDKKFGGSK